MSSLLAKRFDNRLSDVTGAGALGSILPDVSQPQPDSFRWFATQVQPHGPVLRAWLRSRFAVGAEIEDIMQESFVRVLRAHAAGEVKSPKAFLFTTARNLTLDYLRRQRITGQKSLVEDDWLTVLDENEDIAGTVDHNQELSFLTEAIQSLPDRCRQVFTLRKIYGMTQQEIANRLGISEHTVSAQLTIGLHKCTEYFSRFNWARGGKA